MNPVLIKTTEDGRKVEVIGLDICLDGKPECKRLQHVFDHPYKDRILKALPNATHMAGRVPLTSEEARIAIDAISANEAPLLSDQSALQKRLITVASQKAWADGVE